MATYSMCSVISTEYIILGEEKDKLFTSNTYVRFSFYSASDCTQSEIPGTEKE